MKTVEYLWKYEFVTQHRSLSDMSKNSQNFWISYKKVYFLRLYEYHFLSFEYLAEVHKIGD